MYAKVGTSAGYEITTIRVCNAAHEHLDNRPLQSSLSFFAMGVKCVQNAFFGKEFDNWPSGKYSIFLTAVDGDTSREASLSTVPIRHCLLSSAK